MVNRWEEYLKISGWASDYPSVNNLLRHLKYRKIGSESSRCIYGNAVYAFCHHTDKLPDELVTLEKVDVEKLVENFCYQKMEKGWRSPRTANTTLFMLKTFFKVNGFRGSKKLEIDCFHQSVRERTRPEYIPTLDEARRMANVAGSLRNRAIVLFMASTGLRNSTLRALLYADVKEELEKGAANILIKVHKDMKRIVNSACKGNTEYSVFTSEEAAEALKLYLNHRRRFGEIHNEEVLFCSEHNRLSRKERANKPLTARELQIIVKAAARKAGVKEWKNVVPHALRKTFESVLRSQFADGGRLDLKTQEYFMGHILGGSMDTYFDKTKTEELRKEYAKLIFKPEKQASIEVLESLLGMARVLGIDLAGLEESKAAKLGRGLNDAEKLELAQYAIGKAINEFKKAVESNAKTELLTRSFEQNLEEKNQVQNSNTAKAHHEHITLQNSISKPGSSLIPSPTEQICDIQKKILGHSSIQLDLGMRPQEHFIKSQHGNDRGIRQRTENCSKEKRNEGNLLKFLN